MRDEILAKALDTDTTVVPRYDIVDAAGQTIGSNVAINLKNAVVQQGTPYNTASVLPSTVPPQLGLAEDSTPADMFERIAAMLNISLHKLVTYYSSSSDIADTMLDGTALVPLSATSSSQLYNLFGAKEGFAYIIQIFYSSVSTSSPRVQIAMGYVSQRMAIRQYYRGWTSWKLVRVDDPTNMVTTLDLLRAASSSSGQEASITATLTAGVSAGSAVASGGTVKLSNSGDYAEFTLSIPGSASNKYLVFLNNTTWNTSGASAYSSKDSINLYINNVSYIVGNSSMGYYATIPDVQVTMLAGKVLTTRRLRLRFTCITTQSSNVGRTYGTLGSTSYTIPARIITIQGGIT